MTYSKLREWVDKELKLVGYEHQQILDKIDSLEKETDIDQEQVKENIRVMDEQDGFARPLVQLPEVREFKNPFSVEQDTLEAKMFYSGFKQLEAITTYLLALQKHPKFQSLINNK